MWDGNKKMMRRWVGLGFISGMLTIAFGCGRIAESGTDSSTHWLRRCSTNTECGQLSCVYGVCTKACEASSECATLRAGALCQPLSDTSQASLSVCTASCTASSDCHSIAADLQCEAGTCLPAAGVGQGGAAESGSGGRGATSDGTRTASGASGTNGNSGTATSQGGASGRSGASTELGGSANTGGTLPGSGGRGGAANTGIGGMSGGSGSLSTEAGSAGASGDRLVLEASTITFFSLPIDSVRYAVAGYDAAHRTCATVIWNWSPFGGARCSDATAGANPYVVIVPNTDPPCSNWEYGGNVEAVGWKGCVDFASGGTGINRVDAEVTVQGDSFSGTIVAKKGPAGAVTFGFEYLSDLPESVYVQSSDPYGNPAWLHVTKAGEAVRLFDDCAHVKCDSEPTTCDASQRVARSITRGSASTGVYGSVYATWDGYIRSSTTTQTGECIVETQAAPGNYQVEICYGLSTVDNAGAEVENPTCVTRDFTYPTDRVVVTVDHRG